MINWKDRARAGGIHLGISLAVALLAALLVFGVWYPYPYREISGGRELFQILVTVDVLMGPLITFSIFNRSKPMRELRRDLAIVGLLQLAALGYGLWTVYLARPVHLVYEISRFRVVHAVDVPADLLAKAKPGLAILPVTGPTLLSVRPFVSENEKADATLADIAGMPIGTRPDLWQPYAAARTEVLANAKPVSELKQRLPASRAAIDKLLTDKGLQGKGVVYLPLVGRNQFWTVFVDPVSADVLAFMPLDPY